jgi:hypothetical protein
MDYLRLHLGDEAPELGSGHRAVLVVSVGPSWAHLLDPSDATHTRLPRGGSGRLKGYDDLARAAVSLPLDPERLVARLVKNAVACGRWTGVVRGACLRLGADPATLPPVGGEGAAAPDVTAAPGGGVGQETPREALPGEKIGAFVERQWLTGLRSPEEVVTLAHAAFAGCRVDLSHVRWYAGRLRRKGIANVPEFPSARSSQ